MLLCRDKNVKYVVNFSILLRGRYIWGGGGQKQNNPHIQKYPGPALQTISVKYARNGALVITSSVDV